jgi:AcrR family transcriptional regulator
MDHNLLLPDDARAPRADAQKNHALLLETAQRLFAEQGLENVSMSAIAEAAGVGKGTLYRHFRNKSDLAHALLDQDMHDLQTRALRRLNQHADPLDNLRWFLEQVVRFVDRNTPLLCVAALDQDGMALLTSPAHRWWRQTIRGLLLRLEPRPTLDCDYLADMLYVLVDVRTLNFQRGTLGYDLDHILRNLDAAVLRLTS